MAVSVFKVKTLGWAVAMTQGWDKVLIAAGTFGILVFTTINPALVILGAAILGWLIYRKG
jgi:chromate transport protein ChrA